MRRLATALLTLLCATVLAGDSDDIAFLEFLGSFTDDNGEWLDPLLLEQAITASDSTALVDESADATADDPQDEPQDDDNES